MHAKLRRAKISRALVGRALSPRRMCRMRLTQECNVIKLIGNETGLKSGIRKQPIIDPNDMGV
jgi:hypothetical protein